MSISLIDALAEVDLAPGQTYRCSVKGYQVVLHVLPVSASQDVDAPFDDPFEHPFPTPAMRTKVSFGSLPLPEPVVVSPEDYEEPTA